MAHRYRIGVFLIFILGGLLSLSFAQNFSFRNLSKKDGIPDNTVSVIIQDHLGFLWMGTPHGLVRYDGHETIVYKPDSSGIDSLGKAITALKEDHKGNLWIGTSNGLSYFDRRLKTFKNYIYHRKNSKSINRGGIMMIHEDKEGGVWVITRTKKNEGFLQRMNEARDGFISYSQKDKDSNEIIKNKIVFLWSPRNFSDSPVLMSAPTFFEDTSGTIWLGTYGEGLKRFDRDANKFIKYINDSTNPRSISNDSIISIFEDKQTNLWIGTRNGVNRFDRKTEKFYRYVNRKNDLNSISASLARVVWEDKNGLLWVNTQKGLDRLNPVNGMVEHFYSKRDKNNRGKLPHPLAIPIHEEKNGKTWFLSWKENNFINRIHRYDPTTNFFLSFNINDAPKHGLRKGITIHNYFVDRTGILYISSHKGEVNILDLPSLKFDEYYPGEKLILKRLKPDTYTINTARKRSEKLLTELWAAEDENGILWLKGITNKSIISPVRASKKDSKGNWWLSSNLTGFSRINFEDRVFTRFYPDKDALNRPYNFGIASILEDSDNHMWFGSLGKGGILRFISDEEGFIRTKYDPNEKSALNGHSINSIIELNKNELLAVRKKGGLYKFDKTSFEEIKLDIGASTILKLYCDSKNRFWAGTVDNGLIKFDGYNGKVIRKYTTSAGLANNTIRDIIEDKTGKLWIRTDFGLTKFDPEEESFVNFDSENGLIANMSNFGNSFRENSEGKFFLINFLYQPLSAFFAEEVIRNPYEPSIAFTALEVFSDDQNDSSSFSLMENITVTEQISLSHFQNNFTFSFRALDYSQPEKNTYAVKLEPYESEWRYIGKYNVATFTNIPPGSYTFRVKAANCEGVWNEKGIAMKITISPPWWETIWAYILFGVISFFILYKIYKYQLNRRLEIAETIRLKELDTVKTRLYTNITHEFRTPLTVISGLADQIKEPEESRNYILRNSNHLLQLVNQMLDLSKLESGKLQLDLKRGNVIAYIHYLVESFQSYAESKNLSLIFKSEIAELFMDYDDKKIQQIVVNLLSNAIKFSSAEDTVMAQLKFGKEGENEFLTLAVKDQGIGIPEENLPHIFERFYQVDDSLTRKGEGTGIGLTLTSELVRLMGGKISVESKVNQGTTFTIDLPVKREAENRHAELIIEQGFVKPFLPLKKTGIDTFRENDLPLILIIEDNSDVIFYIKTCLEGLYQVIEAENGLIGIEKALKDIPDLIISDVMMPEKDGFEVCNTLKNDERTSHIPIILLTAKADIESRLEGLQEGADVYLAKPFEKKELLIRMEQLIILRKKLQERYKDLHGTPAIVDPVFEREDSFLIKAKQFIEDNLSNDELSVEQLAGELGMSRSQLFRKLKALTGKSVILFIRSYRLARARQLLKTTQLSVSEIAYEVGFKSPAHFSTAFLKEFGVQPSQMRLE